MQEEYLEINFVIDLNQMSKQSSDSFIHYEMALKTYLVWGEPPEGIP